MSSLDHLHKKLRGHLQLPNDCVIHSFRHTFLTRFGEAGADAFTIKKVAGQSSVTIPERYIHPTPEGQERAPSSVASLRHAAVEKAETDRSRYSFRYSRVSTGRKLLCPCSSTVRAADS